MKIFMIIALILFSSIFMNNAKKMRKKHFHDKPNYFQNIINQFGPTARAIFETPEIQNAIAILTELHEKFETKDLEDQLEYFINLGKSLMENLNFSFGNFGFQDINTFLTKGIDAIVESPFMLQLISQQFIQNGVLPPGSNAVEETAKIIRSLMHDETLNKALVQIKDFWDSHKEGFYSDKANYTMFRIMGENVLDFSGFLRAKEAKAALNSLVSFLENFMDYLFALKKTVITPSKDAADDEEKPSLLIAILKDMIQVPYDRICYALRNAEETARNLQSIEFLPEKFGKSKAAFQTALENLISLARDLQDSGKAGRELKKSYETLQSDLLTNALQMKPHLDKLSRDLKIGSKTLDELRPAENLATSGKKIADLVVDLRIISTDVDQAIAKIKLLDQIVGMLQKFNHQDINQYLLVIQKFRDLIDGSTKFNNIVDEMDNFTRNMNKVLF